MFQDEWCTNKKFADWIGKANKLPEARCVVCKKSIDISLMGVLALDYHAKCAKHQKNLKDLEGMDIQSMFSKKSAINCCQTRDYFQSRNNDPAGCY